MPEETSITLNDIDEALHEVDVGGDVIQSDPQEIAAEAEAGKKGWVPKDKYRGDPAKWKPASEFLAAGERFNKNLQARLEKIERENEELKKSGQAFAKYHEQQMEAKQAEIDTAIRQLRVQSKQATADGEHNLAIEIEDRIELLKEEKQGLKEEAKQEAKKEPTYQEAVDNASKSLIVREWVEDGNEWFDQSAELRTYAVEYGNQLYNQTTVRGRKFLDLVTEHMREEFPRQFAKLEGKTVERKNNIVESGEGAGNVKSGSYSIRDLPAEDLALMRDFVSKGWTTPEKFLKGYFENNGNRKTHRTK